MSVIIVRKCVVCDSIYACNITNEKTNFCVSCKYEDECAIKKNSAVKAVVGKYCDKCLNVAINSLEVSIAN